MILSVIQPFTHSSAAAAKSLQSCPTLGDPIDCRRVHQAPPSLGFSRQEHWSGLPFPSPMHESEKWKVKVKLLSRVRLLATPWAAAYQAPPSMGFSRQEYWSGVPLPSPIHSSRNYLLRAYSMWVIGLGCEESVNSGRAIKREDSVVLK